MELELPEGVTINDYDYQEQEVPPHEFLKSWNCVNCNMELEAFLIGENGRYRGQIRIVRNDSIAWQGSLPRDRDKAVKALLEELQRRSLRHTESCR